MARAPKDPAPELPVLTEQPVDENDLPVLTEAPEQEAPEHHAELPVLTDTAAQDSELPVLTEAPTTEAPPAASAAETPRAADEKPSAAEPSPSKAVAAQQAPSAPADQAAPAVSATDTTANASAQAAAPQPAAGAKAKTASGAQAEPKPQTVKLTDEQLRKIAAYVAPEVEKLIRKKVSTTLDALWPKIWAEAEAEIPEMIRSLIIDLAKHTRK